MYWLRRHCIILEPDEILALVTTETCSINTNQEALNLGTFHIHSDHESSHTHESLFYSVANYANNIPAFDLTDYYPINIKPLWTSSFRDWYIGEFGDRFFYNAPAWFPILTFLELVYHLPLTLWAIPALLRNDPRIPLALLVFGLETSLTTLVCLAEMLSWEELTPVQRGVQGLGGMYGGYLATGTSDIQERWRLRVGANVKLGIFMTLDCYARLDQMIAKKHRELEPVTKKEL
jgi:hypothetical protein